MLAAEPNEKTVGADGLLPTPAVLVLLNKSCADAAPTDATSS
jgi:hypothetical protein